MQCNNSTCLGIGEGIVVVRHFVAAVTGDDIQVMMSFRPHFTRTEQGTFKLIVRIGNLIGPEHSLQAVLVKRFIMRYKGHFSVLDVWEILMYLAHRLRPYIRELGRTIGIVKMQSIYFAAAGIVVVRYRSDERVVVIHYLAVFDDDQSDRTNA